MRILFTTKMRKEIVYKVFGETDIWMYERLGSYAMVIEIPLRM